MATIDITEENHDEVIDAGGIVFLDFWAEWCGPCKAFSPVYLAASEMNPDIVFGKVNTEDAGQLAAAAGIQAIPTLVVFRESIIVFSQAGALPTPALADLISDVRSLDMNAIRAASASHADGDGHIHH